VIPILSTDPKSPFPPVEQALDSPRGLLAAGGDLSPVRLVNAYRHGIFPWYSGDQPILWWSPTPRCVLYPDRVHLSKRLRRRFNQGQFKVTADRAFEQVIEQCAQPRQADPVDEHDGTWITADMQTAYIRLHQLGIAHSVEIWTGDKLAGGLYGLVLGSVFFGESMFSGKTDASKIALVALCRQLQQWKFGLMDCQVSNQHLLSMGAEEIPRVEFRQHLNGVDAPSRWEKDFKCDPCW